MICYKVSKGKFKTIKNLKTLINLSGLELSVKLFRASFTAITSQVGKTESNNIDLEIKRSKYMYI